MCKCKFYNKLHTAWGNEDTQTIIKILKEKNVHVTFFMTGGWVDTYPDDVKALYKA